MTTRRIPVGNSKTVSAAPRFRRPYNVDCRHNSKRRNGLENRSKGHVDQIDDVNPHLVRILNRLCVDE